MLLLGAGLIGMIGLGRKFRRTQVEVIMKTMVLGLLALALVFGGVYLIDNEKYFIALCAGLLAFLLAVINANLHEIRGLLKKINNLS